MTDTVKDAPPLTDADRAQSIEEHDGLAALDRAGEVLRLYVAEVRRLRSDEWLEKAAREMLEYADGADPSPAAVEAVLAILRKHRG